MFTMNYADSRYNPHSSVTGASAAALRLKWFYEAASPGSTSQPVVSNGVVYFDDWGGYVYAVNLTSGVGIWKTRVFHALSSTPAVMNGIVYVATLIDCEVIALNQTTGSVMWNTTLSTNNQLGIWASPIVFKGRVYVGLASLGNETNPALKGELDSLNASTGRILWSFNTMIGNSGGAGVWGSVAIDQARNKLYFGTGNPYVVNKNTTSLYSDSIICLNTATGKLVWYYQVHANDTADRDFGSTPNLFSVTINGTSHYAVGLGSKDAYYYIWDRISGKLLEKILVGGGPSGAVIGLAGFTSNSNPEIFIPAQLKPVNSTCCGQLVAYFPSNNSIAWIYPTNTLIGSVAIGKGVVLFGDKTGILHAASATSGTSLFSYALPAAIESGVTIVQNYALVTVRAVGKPTNASTLGLYAFCIKC
jgi:polyvinyl alcohol dehydrogenase (cytochrome)